jgi:abequosyltransferase
MTPLLTIAIPTYNRSGYLRLNLEQLASQIRDVAPGMVEVLVSDNCSPDDTGEVVKSLSSETMPIQYVRNASNVGWARNFAQAFDLARGKYILMSGDDDLLVDGALQLLLDKISGKDYGVVCVRPYGYDDDFRAERPELPYGEKVFADSGEFLIAVHRWFTLTSALVLNKSLLAGVSSKEFLDTDLATFHLLLRASLAAKENLFINAYLLASKRQNSFSYEYADVFVDQFWRIMDAQKAHGLKPETIRAIENRRLLAYYPFYMFDLRSSGRGNIVATRGKLAGRFRGRLAYELWVAPTLFLPRPMAIAWGAATTIVGRAGSGDLRRGLKFARSKVRSWFSGKRGA